MTATAVVLVDAVDSVVGQDLRALSFEQLQSLFIHVAPQVQRLEGFSGAVLAELHTRGGGTVPTEDGRSRPLPGWAAESSGDSASAAGRLIRTASALQEGPTADELADLRLDRVYRAHHTFRRLCISPRTVAPGAFTSRMPVDDAGQ